MSLLSKIFIAYILDLIFGDPINVTHPVQIIGKLIDFLEKKLYTKKEEETEEFDVEEKKIGKDKNNKTSKKTQFLEWNVNEYLRDFYYVCINVNFRKIKSKKYNFYIF